DAADLGGPGSRCIHRVEPVHIERDIGAAVADHPARFLDHAVDAEFGELLDEDHAHAMGFGELDAIHEVLATANADLDGALRVQHTGLHRQPKWGSVRELG